MVLSSPATITPKGRWTYFRVFEKLPKPQAKCSASGRQVDRFPEGRIAAFFDISRERNEKYKKMLKMKVGPNKVLKTKVKKATFLTIRIKYRNNWT